jgi:hypothetical protein
MTNATSALKIATSCAKALIGVGTDNFGPAGHGLVWLSCQARAQPKRVAYRLKILTTTAAKFQR